MASIASAAIVPSHAPETLNGLPQTPYAHSLMATLHSETRALLQFDIRRITKLMRENPYTEVLGSLLVARLQHCLDILNTRWPDDLVALVMKEEVLFRERHPDA